jgi:hypothetical protein
MDREDGKFFESIAPDRRRFVKRILAMSAFAAPAVRIFTVALESVEESVAQATTPKAPPTTAPPPTTTTSPTTTFPPGIPLGYFFFVS